MEGELLESVKESGSFVDDSEDVIPPPDVNFTSEDNIYMEGGWIDILGTGQLKKRTIGKGADDSRPERPDVCIVSYVSTLDNGTVVETENFQEVHIGDYEVIQGLDLALALMDVGEVAEVFVAPRFGYGSIGLEPNIPPNVNLNYTVTLHDVKDPPPLVELDLTKRIETGNRKKQRGNWWYSRQENTYAIHCYRKALEYFDDTDLPIKPSDEEMHIMLEEKLKTYNNLAAAQLKIKALDAALMSLDNVLLSQPNNVKALFRKAKILKEKGETFKGIAVIRQALAIQPDSKTLLHELSNLLAAQRKDNSQQKSLYKKMLGSSIDSNSNSTKKSKEINQTLKWKWIALIGVAAATIGAFAVKYKY